MSKIQRTVKDIHGLVATIQKRWERRSNSVTLGAWSDSRHVWEDRHALDRCVAWGAARGWAPALRLEHALPDLTLEEHQHVQQQLRIAKLSFVRTLAEQPDGTWIRLPLPEGAYDCTR